MVSLLKQLAKNGKLFQQGSVIESIERNLYLAKLIRKRGNVLIKIITGIRRCGKSDLLHPLFKSWLLQNGILEDHIVKISLDQISYSKFHDDPEGFDRYVRSFIKDSGTYYLLLDEIQLVNCFALVLTGLLYEKNLDIYVTGSNSEFLLSAIVTEFRGRGDQIHVWPLSFAESMSAYGVTPANGWQEYLTHGGMPSLFSQQQEDKDEYLQNLCAQTYLRDIVDRNHVIYTHQLEEIICLLASSVVSLTNAKRIYDTFRSNGGKELSMHTIHAYLSYLEDAFLVEKPQRYDIKGRRYLASPQNTISWTSV